MNQLLHTSWLKLLLNSLKSVFSTRIKNMVALFLLFFPITKLRQSKTLMLLRKSRLYLRNIKPYGAFKATSAHQNGVVWFFFVNWPFQEFLNLFVICSLFKPSCSSYLVGLGKLHCTKDNYRYVLQKHISASSFLICQ